MTEFSPFFTNLCMFIAKVNFGDKNPPGEILNVLIEATKLGQKTHRSPPPGIQHIRKCHTGIVLLQQEKIILSSR
jgi:hypothetical protein